MPSILHKLRAIDLYGRPVNLRFEENDYFKTNFGFYSTVFLFLTTLAVFGVEFYNVLRGEVIGITTQYVPFDRQRLIDENWKDNLIAGFAFEKGSTIGEYLEVERVLVHKTSGEMIKLNTYNCTEFVFENMTEKARKEVPVDLDIRCVKVDAEYLMNG